MSGTLMLPGWNYAQSLSASSLSQIQHQGPEEAASNEDFWHEVRQAFTTSPNVIYLNNGNVSPHPRLVQEAIHRYNQFSNEGPGYYMRRIVTKGKEYIRRRLADIIACSPDEIALNRNATEGLQTLIFWVASQCRRRSHPCRSGLSFYARCFFPTAAKGRHSGQRSDIARWFQRYPRKLWIPM